MDALQQSPWPWIAAAGVLAALGAGLCHNALSTPPNRGFWMARYASATCEGEPVERRIVDEPVALRRPTPEGCVRWVGYRVVDRFWQGELEVDAEGRVAIHVDGESVLQHDSDAIEKSGRGRVELTPGVYRFELEHRHRGTGETYLRVREHDRRGPHYEYVLEPLAVERYFPDEASARDALARGLPPPHAPRALLALGCLLLAALCLWCAWRAREARRGHAPLLPGGDVVAALAVTLAALEVRAGRLHVQDLGWDERAYVVAGRHMIRSLQLGDLSQKAFRHNYPHPPVAKWIYGLGWELGGQDGARLASVCMAAVAVGLTFVMARLLFDRATAWVAGLCCVMLPTLVAHGRLTGLESPVLCFWMLSLVAAVTWAQSAQAPGRERGDPVAAVLVPLFAVLALGSRMTAVWLAPLLLVLMVQGNRGRRGLAGALPPAPALLGALAGVALLALAWPYMWPDPVGAWDRILRRWQDQRTTEFFLGRDMAPPPAIYYAAAFVATTPVAVTVAALIGAVVGVRARTTRAATLLCLLWLVLPFGQSVSRFRQDLARYVIPAWPALSVLAGVGAVHLGRVLRGWLGRAPRAAPARLAAVLSLLPAALLVADVTWQLRSVEPYPLDYFNRTVGGPAGVARRRMFELGYWGEGYLAAAAWLDAHAAEGVRVHLRVTPRDTFPRLRDDLELGQLGGASYVVQNHYKFDATQPEHCKLAHRVALQGVPLVDVLACDPNAIQACVRLDNSPNHGTIAATGTEDVVHLRVRFTSGAEITREVDMRTVSGLHDVCWMERPRRTACDIRAMHLSTDGEDWLWIDQVEVLRAGVRVWSQGSDNTQGWCLSIDPSDGDDAWCEPDGSYPTIPAGAGLDGWRPDRGYCN